MPTSPGISVDDDLFQYLLLSSSSGDEYSSHQDLFRGRDSNPSRAQPPGGFSNVDARCGSFERILAGTGVSVYTNKGHR